MQAAYIERETGLNVQKAQIGHIAEAKIGAEAGLNRLLSGGDQGEQREVNANGGEVEASKKCHISASAAAQVKRHARRS